jgi:hypothetical protein
MQPSLESIVGDILEIFGIKKTTIINSIISKKEAKKISNNLL